MKQVIGLAFFLASIPIFITLLKGSLAQRRTVYFLLGALPYLIQKFDLDVALMSWAYWPGYVKGASVSLLDSAALAVLIVCRHPVRQRPLLGLYWLFLFGTAVSIAFANTWLASAFFTWQVGRCLLVFAAVALVTSRPDGLRYVLGGLAAGIGFQACFSLQQKLSGIYQAGGAMGNQNLLGIASHFALLLSFAALLGSDRRWIVKVGVAGALIAVVFTGSRATTGLALAGVALLLLLSIVRKQTAFKMKAVGGAFACLLIAAPLAYANLNTRFESKPIEGGDEEREAFERAAKAMWSDHPMGVGANQYVVIANGEGYSARAGVIWNGPSRATNVHNSYLLLGAETGYLGLGSYLLLFFGALWTALKVAWARPRRFYGEVALGAAVTLIVVGCHMFYEWVFLVWVVQYLFAILLGVIAGCANQRAIELRARRSGRKAPAPPDRRDAAGGASWPQGATAPAAP